MSDKVYIPPLIEGGYFLVARAIFDSSLWTMCPTDRIVATYLIGKSNHAEQKWFDRYKQHDIVIQRGEFVTSYNKIATENHITYKQSRDSIKRLLKHGVIEIVGEKGRMGSTAFLYIRVIKYGIYQNPNNYEGQYKVNIKSTEGQDKVEQRATNKNDNTLKNDNNDKKIILNYEGRVWENITDKDLTGWKETYPALNIDMELKKMVEWCISNPNNRKSNWRRFITNWLARAQDSAPRGGKDGSKADSRIIGTGKQRFEAFDKQHGLA